MPSSVATDSGGHAVPTLRRFEWSCGVLDGHQPVHARLRDPCKKPARGHRSDDDDHGDGRGDHYCGPSHRDWRSNIHARVGRLMICRGGSPAAAIALALLAAGRGTVARLTTHATTFRRVEVAAARVLAPTRTRSREPQRRGDEGRGPATTFQHGGLTTIPAGVCDMAAFNSTSSGTASALPYF
jgi:hypothetical protein